MRRKKLTLLLGLNQEDHKALNQDQTREQFRDNLVNLLQKNDHLIKSANLEKW